MHQSEKYMGRCLELAVKGKGKTSPNPMVGAVIVANGRIIGEGYHIQCGAPHAEVNAIASVKDRHLLKYSTLYVNLEPCSHYGKTPPCTNLIIKSGIPNVIIGGLDPFPEVAGKGVKLLQNTGIQVQTGICLDECEELNKRFLTFHRKLRPYIFLKWAQSADGFIGQAGQNIQFSTLESQHKVHEMRSVEEAILIGTNTAIIDNPQLTNRFGGKSPLRMVIDRTLRIPQTNFLFDGSQKTIIFTEKKEQNRENLEFIPLDFSHNILPQMMEFLYKRNIQSLIVEGGRTLLQSFIDAKLVDELRIEISTKKLGKGISIPAIELKETFTEICGKNRIVWNKPLF